MTTGMVHAASRRVGMKFRLTGLSCGSRYVGGNPRLTPADVSAIRRWASREGWGLSRTEQSEALSGPYRVAPTTLADVLSNRSWFDPDYQPGSPDALFWGQLGLTGLTLHVLQVAR